MSRAPDKFASAYQFPNRLVMHGVAQTVSGFYVAHEPYLSLPTGISLDEIGSVILSVLDGFKIDYPRPTNWPELTKKFLQDMRVKSNRKLQEDSILCNIAQYGECFEFIPTHNGGTRGDKKGFSPIPGGEFSIPGFLLKKDLGGALQRSFELCTSVYKVPKSPE
jgi:hypothetical protein